MTHNIADLIVGWFLGDVRTIRTHQQGGVEYIEPTLDMKGVNRLMLYNLNGDTVLSALDITTGKQIVLGREISRQEGRLFNGSTIKFERIGDTSYIKGIVARLKEEGTNLSQVSIYSGRFEQAKRIKDNA